MRQFGSISFCHCQHITRKPFVKDFFSVHPVQDRKKTKLMVFTKHEHS